MTGVAVHKLTLRHRARPAPIPVPVPIPEPEPESVRFPERLPGTVQQTMRL